VATQGQREMFANGVRFICVFSIFFSEPPVTFPTFLSVFSHAGRVPGGHSLLRYLLKDITIRP
jgi:hypothetical protein